LLALHATTYLTFITFYLGFVGIGYALLGFPLLKCLWSHFSEKEGMVTGILFGVFGFATFFFLLLITYLANPHNEEATEMVYIYYNHRFMLDHKSIYIFLNQ